MAFQLAGFENIINRTIFKKNTCQNIKMIEYRSNDFTHTQMRILLILYLCQNIPILSSGKPEIKSCTCVIVANDCFFHASTQFRINLRTFQIY